MISASILIRAMRAPETLLRLVAAANALFFASFLAVLIVAAGRRGQKPWPVQGRI